MSGRKETNQDIDGENNNTTENVVVGRDLTQINKNTQEAGNDPTKFPVDDPKDHGSWVTFFDWLLSVLPVDPDEMDFAFTVTRYASWIVGLGSAASLMRQSLPIKIEVLFDGQLFVIAVLFGVISGAYFKVRSATDCPECGTPFALDSVQAYEYPELSDSEKVRGERTVNCEACEYQDTEQITWEPNED